MLRRFLSCALAAAAILFASSPSGMAADLLTIGSDAPALDIEFWVQDGEGKYKPVTKFQKGKVYVVEFWATWCGPCRMCMPHLAETQAKYADKGVQIVSVSNEDLDTVNAFLKTDIPRRGPAAIQDKEKAEKIKTYKDLTSAYCLTTDPDESVNKAYMEAAVQQGIPTCFIVGKDSKIEWIGHPMEMDEPLEQVIADKWDRKKFGAEFTPKQEADFLVVQINEFLQKGDLKGAMAYVDEALTKVKGPASGKLRTVQLQLMMNDKASADKVPAALSAALEEVKSDATAVNELVWNLVAPMEQGAFKKNDKVLELLLPAIKAAAEKGSGDDRAMVMDSLAHVQSMLGDLDGAIKTEQAAVEMSSRGLKEQLKQYLDKLESDKKASEKKDEKKDK